MVRVTGDFSTLHLQGPLPIADIFSPGLGNRNSDLTYASYVNSPGLSSMKSPPTDYQPIPQQSKEVPPIAELPGAVETVTPELSGGETSELPGSPSPQPPAQSPGISSLGGFSDQGQSGNDGKPIQGLGLQ